MTEPREWPHRRAQLFAAGAAVVGVWTVVIFSLQAVFEPGLWRAGFVAICAMTIAIACMVRAIWPNTRTAAGVLGGLGGLVCWWFLADRAGRASEWLFHPKTQVDSAIRAALSGYAPVDATGPLADVAMLVILLAVTASALLLVGGSLPLAAGALAALFLLVPFVIVGLRIPPGYLILAGAFLMLLAWLGSPTVHWAGLATTGLALALAAVTLQVAPETRDKVWNGSVVRSPVSTTVPDVTVSLAADLRQRGSSRAFTFTSEIGGPQYFTLATLRDFTEGRWLPDAVLSSQSTDTARSQERAFAGSTFVEIFPESGEVSVYESSGSEQPEIQVTIDGLISEWLPLPQAATRVTSKSESFDPSAWVWAESSATAFSDSAITRRGDIYSVEVAAPVSRYWALSVLDQISPESLALLTDPAAVPVELAPYLALPDQIPEVLTETAHHIAGGAEPDRLALAIQLESYFQSGEFVYDEAAPYTPGTDRDNPYSVMEAFLTEKRGFCVHFASTYAVMARSLGIPTRLAVGYAVNAADGQPTAVRGRELHAWPEIYVEELGWIPMEPTPGGAGMRALDPEFEEPEVLPTIEPADEVPEPLPEEPTIDPVSPTTPDDGDTADDPAVASGTLRALGIAALVGGTLLIPALTRLARRLWRGRTAREPSSQAWAEFRDTAVDLGYLSDGDGSPRAHTADALVDYLVGRGILGATAAESARELAHMMEAERYGEETPSGNPQGSLEIARAALLANATPGVRARAVLLPRSLVR